MTGPMLGVRDIAALAEERGIDDATLEMIFATAAVTVLELNGAAADLCDGPVDDEKDAVLVVVADGAEGDGEWGLGDFFQAHGIEPELGLEQFLQIVRGLIRYGTEDVLCVPSNIEETLTRDGFTADILRSFCTAEDLEAAIRVERGLARRGFTPAEIDQLLGSDLEDE